MTAIELKSYDKAELLNLLESNPKCFVINGDDIDELLRREDIYDIEFIDYYDGEEFYYYNPHLLRNEEIFRGASIYKIITIDMMKQIKARDKQIELAENIVDYLLHTNF